MATMHLSALPTTTAGLFNRKLFLMTHFHLILDSTKQPAHCLNSQYVYLYVYLTLKFNFIKRLLPTDRREVFVAWCQNEEVTLETMTDS